jgi:hypothetical protein
MNLVIDHQRVADLGAEFITLTEAKTQLRVTFSDDDSEITDMITRARKAVETYCNISIVYQRILAIIDYRCEWKLPFGPVIGIESVQDSAGVCGSGPITYETADTNWRYDGSEFWPGSGNRYRVTYTSGNYCPDDLKKVILEVISFMYENRGADKNVSDLSEVLKLADSFKVMLWI